MELADLINLELWIRHLRGGVHFGAAAVGLLLGPVVLARPKGDQPHRWLGRIWVLAMLAVNLSAFTMYDVNGRPNLFHAFGFLSLYALVPGFLAIRRYRRTRDAVALRTHQVCMHWAYFGLAAAGIWQIISRYAVLAGGFEFVGTLWVLGGLTALVSWTFGHWLKQRYPL